MQEQLKEMIMDMEKIGICKGDVLFVHSSLSALGRIDGGSKTVVDGLLHAIGNQGTLLMPAFSYATTVQYPYYFSMEKSVCCVGAIPEYYRGLSTTKRSLNPTHSICGCGVQAEELLNPHSLDCTPVGKHSPLSALTNCKGKILFLGCGLNSNTLMHGVEEDVGVNYVLKQQPVEYLMELSNTQLERKMYYQHDFERYKQCYYRLEQIISPKFVRKGKVLAADCILLNAQEAWRSAEEKMRQDPFFFVEKVKID